MVERGGDGPGAVAKVSIVVPTYNRRQVLPEVLSATASQEASVGFELVVVDDGSTDGTAEYLANELHQIERSRDCVGLSWRRQENAGPAAARNLGVAAASGEVVAFLGDDTVPARGWLAAHLEGRSGAEQRRDGGEVVATIGYTAWHHRMRLNPFLKYINEYGLQFGYALIDDPWGVPFNFLYTSNLTLARECLLEQPFDESFPYAAWEDIEWAYRAQKTRGLRIAYVESARVAHDHPTTIERFCDRQEKAGYCATVFHAKHPEMGAFLGLGPNGPPALPPAGPQRRREWLACRLQKLPVRWPELWEHVLRYHYIRGLQRGWRDRNDRNDRRPDPHHASQAEDPNH